MCGAGYFINKSLTQFYITLENRFCDLFQPKRNDYYHKFIPNVVVHKPLQGKKIDLDDCQVLKSIPCSFKKRK